MKQAQEPGRRIVSKSDYVRLETGRVFMGTVSVCLWCFTAIAALFAFVSFVLGGMEFQAKLSGAIGAEPGNWFLLALTLAASAVAGGFIGRNAMRRSDKIDTGVPLTRANTGYLLASDSLVRPSHEPVEAQETVLLRAAAQGAETPHEQLLRPAEEQG